VPSAGANLALVEAARAGLRLTLASGETAACIMARSPATSSTRRAVVIGRAGVTAAVAGVVTGCSIARRWCGDSGTRPRARCKKRSASSAVGGHRSPTPPGSR